MNKAFTARDAFRALVCFIVLMVIGAIGYYYLQRSGNMNLQYLIHNDINLIAKWEYITSTIYLNANGGCVANEVLYAKEGDVLWYLCGVTIEK